MRFAWLGAGAALSMVIAAGCGGQERAASERTGTAAQAIQEGTVDTTAKFKYAVGVSTGGGICSGALIAPNVVVTARHCIQNIDYKNPQVPKTIDCSLNPTFTGAIKWPQVTTDTYFNSATWRQVEDVITPPGTNAVCDNDIALLVLTNQIPAATAKPVVPGVQYPVNYSKYLSSFTAIGYGNTSANGGGAGTRRYRELIRIQCVPGDPNVPCPADFQENEFVAGDGTCSGDSGSAAYEQGSFTFGPTPVALGVLSRGGEDASTCVGSIYTRLDKFRDLVINTVKAASNNWTLYPEPSWTTFVPPEDKDAGTAKPDAGTTPKPASGLEVGDACDVDSDCKSGHCGEGLCTTACVDDSTCPEGTFCREDLCLAPVDVPADPAPTSTTTTTEGCSTSGGPTPWGSFLLAGLVAVGLGASRRRRP